jgi:hypothetical protein
MRQTVLLSPGILANKPGFLAKELHLQALTISRFEKPV